MVAPALVKHLQPATSLYASLADHQLVRATATRDGYRRYRERALGFERGLEAALANSSLVDWSPDARAKSPLMASDLVALGASVESLLALPTYDLSGSIRDSVDAIGWLYVSERVSFAHGLAYHQLDPATRAATSCFNTLLVRTGWFRAQRAWFAEPRSRAELDAPDLTVIEKLARDVKG